MPLQSIFIDAKQNSEDAMLEILQKFKPILLKYARLLKDNDAYEDLQCELISILKK